MNNIYEAINASDEFTKNISLADKFLSGIGLNGVSYNLKMNILNKNHFANNDFLAVFRDDDMIANCPVVRATQCAKIGKPMFLVWSEVMLRNRQEREIMYARQDFNMMDGVTIINKFSESCCELIGFSTQDENINFRKVFFENKNRIENITNEIRNSVDIFSYPANRGDPV
jgi:hypothetical protein